MPQPHRIVIVGGGFGGLYAARSLKRAHAQVTLIDRHNYHLFQPLLYQVATGALSPANIAAPLRAVLRKQKNTRVLMAEVVDIDVARRELTLRDADPGEVVPYDALIVATGSQFNYFGHDAWQRAAPGLKTVEDAVTIRRRMLTAFEEAELATDLEGRQKDITFVVVGAGPTGVEMAGALAEVAHATLHENFRNIDPSRTKVVLLEALDHVLTSFPPPLRAKAAASLERLGVTLRLNTRVTHIEPGLVTFESAGHSETLKANCVMWTAGVKASPLGAKLARAAGLETDRAGRLLVQQDLSLPGHPEIFVIGDLANCSHQTGQPLPGVAPVAMQQGRYVAKSILRRLAGKSHAGPFHYRDRGSMATIGKAAAVADLGWIRMSGLPAWIVWLLIHLMYIVQFQNRVLVLIQWAYNYWTNGRSARLITEERRGDP